MEAVLSTISLQSSPLAMWGDAGSFNHWAARMPIGVAAFPRPSRLAQIFALSVFSRTASFWEEGNNRPNSGRILREREAVRPIMSIRWPTPLHKQSDPPMEIARVIPACAPWVIAAPGEFPEISEKIRDITIIAVKIQLMTMKKYPQYCTICLNRGRFHCAVSTIFSFAVKKYLTRFRWWFKIEIEY